MINNDESGKDNTRINTLAEKLKSKLKDFVVLDRQGQLIGEVTDLILDSKRQLNLVVVPNKDQSSRLFLLKSKLIQNIDPSNQSVLVDIDKAEIEDLPEYMISGTPEDVESELPNQLVIPSQSATEGTDVLIPTPLFESQQVQGELDNVSTQVAATPEVLEEEIIRLLGERLVIDRNKRKIGEVIVRKEIEIQMIQVPVRREKLIIEQVSPEHKQLIEINLGQEEVAGIEMVAAASAEPEIASPQIASQEREPTVRGEFNSPKIASLLLNAIALERRHGCKKVRVEIVVEDTERQKIYQEWVNRSSGNLPR